MTRKGLQLALALLFGVFMVGSSQAGTYYLDTELNGKNATGGASWVTATFSSTEPGTVTLTVTPTLAGGEIDWFGFNLDPTLSGVWIDGKYTPADSYKANGDGYYDIALFESVSITSQITYEITGPGINENSFAFLSTGSNQGSYYLAAHILGPNNTHAWIGADDPDPVSVPEPSLPILLGLGIGAASLAARRKEW